LGIVEQAPVVDPIDELQWRGLMALSTDEEALRGALAAGQVTYYCGFDPTAPSLHIGNLVQILTLRRLQLAGHRPLALVGGATGLIGDPRPGSERSLNATDVVAGWVERIRAQIEPYLDFEGPAAARMVNNLDWTAPLSAIDFLRDVGKHFRVNRMLAKDAVAARLNSDAGISYTEFSYQILQGMDFLELYRRYGCTLQTGGSDQWGNLTAGTDLIHRVEGVSVHALATPLVTKADGTKFGKTESGTVWLDPAMTSPYAFFQFWLNSDDRDVANYLRIFTFRSRDELAELEKATAERPQAREAQRTLARDVTSLVHGAATAARVEEAARALFGSGDLAALDASTLADAVAELPRVVLPRGEHPVVDVLVASGLAASRSAARRTIAEGGAYVNNTKVTSETATVDPSTCCTTDGWSCAGAANPGSGRPQPEPGDATVGSPPGPAAARRLGAGAGVAGRGPAGRGSAGRRARSRPPALRRRPRARRGRGLGRAGPPRLGPRGPAARAGAAGRRRPGRPAVSAGVRARRPARPAGAGPWRGPVGRGPAGRRRPTPGRSPSRRAGHEPEPVVPRPPADPVAARSSRPASRPVSPGRASLRAGPRPSGRATSWPRGAAERQAEPCRRAGAREPMPAAVPAAGCAELAAGLAGRTRNAPHGIGRPVMLVSRVPQRRDAGGPPSRGLSAVRDEALRRRRAVTVLLRPGYESSHRLRPRHPRADAQGCPARRKPGAMSAQPSHPGRTNALGAHRMPPADGPERACTESYVNTTPRYLSRSHACRSADLTLCPRLP
jgi:tyrosyl-tRNA synthetase